MTQRLIIGRHPLDGNYGLWLSRPGIHAPGTTDLNNFLICPGVRNEMVLMAGSATNGQFVPFPFALSVKPFVMFNCTTNGGIDWYPFDINVVTKFGDVFINVSQSGMSFADTTGLNLLFLYLVTSRALP